MPTVQRETTKRGRTTVERTNTVRNTVVVNADNEEEAARKGLKYFRYTSRDTYAIESVHEMSPGKWKVVGLIRNPTESDTHSNFHPQTRTVKEKDVRDTLDDEEPVS